jgi:hypothetical protein
LLSSEAAVTWASLSILCELSGGPSHRSALFLRLPLFAPSLAARRRRVPVRSTAGGLLDAGYERLTVGGTQQVELGALSRVSLPLLTVRVAGSALDRLAGFPPGALQFVAVSG